VNSRDTDNISDKDVLDTILRKHTQI
jgi:hypothetical protein